MKIEPTKIPGAYIIEREPTSDERGSFARVFCQNELAAAGILVDIAQINLSRNHKKGTLRGLHSQKGEYAEDKLVACVSGEIFDVCVDVRENSPTFGQWAGEVLSKQNGKMLYVPKGCAHGYLTLSDDTQVLYFVTQFYTPGTEVGYRFDDPAFGIDWPLAAPFVMSEKDNGLMYLWT